MDKIKYDIVLEIKGIVPFRVSKGDLENPSNFKKVLKKHIQTSLGCQVDIKECSIECVE